MDLHIYDMKLGENDAVILSGDIPSDEIESFSGYLQVMKAIFPSHPVIYVPPEATIDKLTKDELISLLCDSMASDDLEYLYQAIKDSIEVKEHEPSN